MGGKDGIHFGSEPGANIFGGGQILVRNGHGRCDARLHIRPQRRATCDQVTEGSRRFTADHRHTGLEGSFQGRQVYGGKGACLRCDHRRKSGQNPGLGIHAGDGKFWRCSQARWHEAAIKCCHRLLDPVHASGKGADAIERALRRACALAADPSEGGLEADDAAANRGLTDGAASVRANGKVDKPSSHGGGRAGGRAAGNDVRPARIDRRAEAGIHARHAIGKLVHVGFGDDAAPGLEESLHHIGVGRCRRGRIEGRRAAARHGARDVDAVLDCNTRTRLAKRKRGRKDRRAAGQG